MSRFKKKSTVLLATAICACTLLTAAPVYAAEIDEAAQQTIAQSVSDYLDNVLTLEAADLDALREYGDFYNTMADAIIDNKEELGDFVQIKDAVVVASDENVICTANVAFTLHDAEILMYFDATGSTPTYFVVNIEYSLGEKLAQAGGNTLIGVVIVFFMLIFLAFIISLFKFINPDARKKKAKKTEDVKPAAAPAAAPAPVQPAAPQTDDLEIIAVISAALAAAEADGQGTGDSYVVRSVKKVGTTRGWKRS